MILTPHSIVGAAIANLIPENPELGFALAYASHYAIDMIPHRDYDIDGFFDEKEKTFASVIRSGKARLKLLMIFGDFVVGVAICTLLFVRNRGSLIATAVGIAGGVLPDFLQLVYYTFKNHPWKIFQKIHDFFHSSNKMKHKPVEGILVQIATPVVCVAIYFLLK